MDPKRLVIELVTDAHHAMIVLGAWLMWSVNWISDNWGVAAAVLSTVIGIIGIIFGVAKKFNEFRISKEKLKQEKLNTDRIIHNKKPLK